jgi:hypothetical protein
MRHIYSLLLPDQQGEAQAQWSGGYCGDPTHTDYLHGSFCATQRARGGIRDQHHHIMASLGLSLSQPTNVVLDATPHRVIVFVDVQYSHRE